MKCKLEECNHEIVVKGRSYCSIECSKIGQVRSRSIIMDSIKEKRKKTNLERYGVENTGQSIELKKKYRETNLNRYGVDNPLKDISVRKKVSDTIDKRYGSRNFQQSHISAHILAKCNDREWLTSEHHKNKKSITLIANELGIDQTTLCRYFHNNSISIIRHSISSFERELKEFIDSIINSPVCTNVRNIIYPYEIDLFMPDINIGFECNGSYWHSELNGKDAKYHLQKTKLCSDKNIELIHIWEHEWKYKTDIVKSMIKSKLGILDKIYARKCTIGVVTTKEEKTFLNNNHLQGYVSSNICYGLYYDSELVSIMSFGRPRYSKHEYELLRFCNTLGTTVLGAASKLFSYAIRNNNIEEIISYSHKDKFTGNLYNQLGFKYSHTSTPSYYYTKDYVNFENRLKYQKHKLQGLLKYFNPEFTEWENMINNEYDRIWDCGNDVWVWKN